MFSGNVGSYFEWVDDLENVLRARHFSDQEKAVYIYDHLEGEAREEIKHQSVEIRRNPERILDILKEVYGCPSTLVKTQKRFFDRKQREGEGLREYSHALMSLSEDIRRCNGGN